MGKFPARESELIARGGEEAARGDARELLRILMAGFSPCLESLAQDEDPLPRHASHRGSLTSAASWQPARPNIHRGHKRGVRMTPPDGQAAARWHRNSTDPSR